MNLSDELLSNPPSNEDTKVIVVRLTGGKSIVACVGDSWPYLYQAITKPISAELAERSREFYFTLSAEGFKEWVKETGGFLPASFCKGAIRDQCRQAQVPFFFKQWGDWNKKAAGRILDGRTYDEMPRVNNPVPDRKDRLAMVEQVRATFNCTKKDDHDDC